MYLWSVLGNNVLGPVETQGITGDPAKAMREAEPYVKDGRAFIGLVQEVQPVINVAELDTTYVATGRQWLGRRTIHGGVRWNETRMPVDRSVCYFIAEGQWAAIPADLSR